MRYVTTEHGRFGYAADFLLYGGTTLALLALLAVSGPRERWPELAAAALVGLFAWTLVEYLLHRFVLHGLQPFRGWHDEHHRRPRARIGTPTALSAALIAALVFLPALVLGDFWRACALTSGLLAGYFSYSVVHHAIHHWSAGSGWLWRRRRMHALHHSPVEPPGRYGVTSAFWDGVFGTRSAGLSASTPASAPVAAQVEVWDDEGGAPAGGRAA